MRLPITERPLERDNCVTSSRAWITSTWARTTTVVRGKWTVLWEVETEPGLLELLEELRAQEARKREWERQWKEGTWKRRVMEARERREREERAIRRFEEHKKFLFGSYYVPPKDPYAPSAV